MKHIEPILRTATLSLVGVSTLRRHELRTSGGFSTWSLALAFAVSVSAFAQTPSATKVWVTDVSHSVVLVHFDSSGNWNFLRIRYSEAPQSCTSGTGGLLELTGYNGQLHPNTDMTQAVGGLLPQTTYEICPEVSLDQKKWYSGASVKVTTLALPSPHPARPIPPRRFDTSYPNTAGFESVTIAHDCHDLIPHLLAALHQQREKGTVINIPAGTVCTADYKLGEAAADVVRFNNSAVNVADSTIRLAHHGYSEGQGLIFGTWYGCLPGSNGSRNCGTEGVGPIVPGQLYYAHVMDANTIQVYSGAAKSAGGTLCKFATSGNGTSLVVKWPRPLHWIIIRTATPDAQFDPEHVRIGPAWRPKMAVLRAPANYKGVNNSNVLFNVSDEDNGLMSMNANIRFVGIEFTYEPSPEAPLSSDSVPNFEMFRSNRFNQNIVVDRCYFHALTRPDRTARAFGWDGMNVAIIDSYIDGLEFYHANYVGMGITKTSPTSFTIDPGSYAWGSGSAKLDRKTTIELSGSSGPGSKTAFAYYSIPGQLEVALPPGMSGKCSPGPCHVFAGLDKGDSLYGAPGKTPDKSEGHNYWIDPVFSSSPSCTQTSSLFSSVKVPLGGFNRSGAANIGLEFASDENGYLCGIRYYRDPAEKGTHSAELLSADGKQLGRAAFASETPSGWQEAKFSRPPVISAGQKYTATINVNDGAFTSILFFQNATTDSGHLHTFAHYVNSNGACNFSDGWPKDFADTDAAAPLGCITIENGAISKTQNADSISDPFDTEGCQCMIGGVGPGPYAFINNYVEGSGNVWHHDDSGGTWATRGDYYYFRNRFHAPLSEMFGGPDSDGLLYGQRHLLEWKAGRRILVEGNVFDGGWVENTPYGEFIDFSAISGDGIRDVDVKNNTFEHAATLLFSPSLITTNLRKPAPPLRFRFENNLGWDITGSTYCTHGRGFCTEEGGFGVILAASQGAEDWIIDHNTIVKNTGSQPSLLWMLETRDEGFEIKDNILYLSPGFGEGIAAGVIGKKNRNCKDFYGKAAADCALEDYSFDHNILTGSDDRTNIRSWWPGFNNYVPSDPSNLSKLGSVVRDPYSGFEDFRPNPDFCADCGTSGDEWKYVGVDVDQLNRVQGKVKAVDVPASSLTATSATVVFEAPDKQSCPVDYSKSDRTLIENFVRVNDEGTDRSRKVTLRGLSPQSTYYYRVNCAVEQPAGSFQTK